MTLVTDSNRLRRVRQGYGVVAAGVAEDVAAVATVVLQHTRIIIQYNIIYDYKPSGFVQRDDNETDESLSSVIALQVIYSAGFLA